MTTHRSRTASRPAVLARRLFTATAAFLMLWAVPTVASADTPEAWDTPPHVSGLDFLLVLLVFPLGLALIISLLTLLPSMISGKGYEPGQPWQSDAEWFGGPTKGVDAVGDAPAVEAGAESAGAESGQGGASGNW